MSNNNVVDRSRDDLDTTPIVLMEASNSRTWAQIHNPSPTNYLGFSYGDVVPTVDNLGQGGAGTYVLPPNWTIILDGNRSGLHPPSDVINIVAASGTGNFVTASERLS